MKKTLLFSRLIAISLMMLFSSRWAVGQTLIISEVSDPADHYDGRFVEIYNATDATIDLSGWQIRVYANGGTTSNNVSLTGSIASGATYTIANSETAFTSYYGSAPDVSSGNISGNGDDVYELFNGTSVVDIYGEVGVDGSGEAWEYLDTRALRNSNITSANTTWSSSEWTIDATADVADCTPGAHTCDLPASGSPIITVSTTTLTGLSYEFGNGPSEEQSFSVEGADLTADITLTAPSNYEISTGTGGSFSATSPITLTQSGGTVASTTIYTRLKAGLAAGDYNAEDITAASTDATSKTVSCSGSVYNQLDWGNLQWPENGTIVRGGDYTVYAQAYEPGVTDAAGQGAGITVWIGYSTSDTDPSTWTNWVAATYSTDVGNNDEYIANIGAEIAAPGLYYYASRFQLESAPYYYGGYNAGAWDGTTNVSGELIVTGAVSVIINEVDADTDGTDVLEFIELYDGGIGNTALDGLVLVLYNGSDDASYEAYDLDTYSTDADGYFVIGNTAVANVDLVASNGFLQNGPDAVALFYGDATDFPNDTPVTTTDLIDAIVYDTDDSDDAALLVLLNASQPQINENGGGNKDFHSNQRFPNGTGGVRNTSTYTQATPTPGAKNLAETNWAGTTDTDWATSGNWSNGVPTSDHNVTIPSGLVNYPDIASATSANCNIMEIESGASLSVAGTLTPSGTRGGIIINSDASASGSLIVTGTLVSVTTKSSMIAPSSTITYNRYVTAGQWHLLSAPVNGQEISSMLTDADNDIELSGSDYSMKDYDEGSDTWNALFTSATTGDMVVGQGYAITRATDGTITMDGEYANAAFTKTLTRTGNGWNLLGNPYPSAVVASRGSDENYLLNTTNVGEMDPAYAAIYVWDEDVADPTNVNNYKTMNNAGSGTLTKSSQINPQVDYLQAGQGFFVKAKTSPGNFTFTTSMQVRSTSSSHFKEDADSWPIVKLNAEISNAKASTTITYSNMMTKGLDVSYDAGLLNSYPDFALYSRLVEDYEGIDFMLQALPEEYETLIVPIGLDAKAGEIITFSAESVNIPEDYAVVLEDRAMNVFTDLSDEAEYTIQLTDDSEGVGRFFVRTSMKSALGIGDVEKGAFQVFTRVNANQLVLRGEFTANTVARIYSITGKQIANFNLDQVTEQSVPFNEQAGVYIVQVSNEQGTYTQKFSWLK